MNIDEFKHRIYQLNRCGCNDCQTQIKSLEHNYYRRQRLSDYYDGMKFVPIPFTMKKEFVAMPDLGNTEAPKIEEPKNMAVKLLVDKLKLEQNILITHQTNIDYHKKALKEHSSKKTATNKNIKELSDALKKLGHKEVK